MDRLNLREALIVIMGEHDIRVAPERIDCESTSDDQQWLQSTLNDLARFGFVAACKKIDISSLPERGFPAVLIMASGDILVASSQTKHDITVYKPDAPNDLFSYILDGDFDKKFSGFAIFIKPENAARLRSPEELPRPKGNWLLQPLRKNYSVYRDIVAASFFANLLAAAIALFAMQVYDRVIPNEAFDTLWILASGVAIAAVFEFSLRSIRTRMIEVSGREIDLSLSSKLYSHIIDMKLKHQPRSIGTFLNRVKELTAVREFLTANTVSSLADVPFSLVFLAIIAFIGGPIVYVVLAAAAISILPGIIFRSKIAAASRENNQESAVYSGLLYETVSNIETIKSTNAAKRMEMHHNALSATVATSSSRARLLTSMIMQISAVAQQVSYVGVVILGVYQISIGNMTIGSLIACTILSSRTLSPMAQVGQLLTRWQSVKNSAASLTDLMETPVDHPDGVSFIRPEKLQGNYSLEDVEFSYESDKKIAISIKSLKINKGERVAILGGIGSGKSTFLRLLSGLYDADKGRILLDNLSLPQIDPSFRTSIIGYLPQNVGVFQGTLRSNLAPAGKTVSDEKMLEVLAIVGLEKFVQTNPKGLDMQISSSRSVSGGQRQMIGLARLILQDPKIVILDEPTASVDQKTEKSVIDFMSTWLHDKTLIMATHKREVLPLCNRLLIMTDGRIAKNAPISDSVTAPQKKVLSAAKPVSPKELT